MLGFIAFKGPPGVVLKVHKYILERASTRENLTLVHLNNTGAGPTSNPAAQSDQCLYCTLMESIISKLASCKISFLFSCTDWFESYSVRNPQDRFSRTMALLYRIFYLNQNLKDPD